MLFREDDEWLAATVDGFRKARPDKVAGIESVLLAPSFWTGPAWAPPRRTDSGASLVLAKLPGKP